MAKLHSEKSKRLSTPGKVEWVAREALIARAVAVIGDREEALRWLGTPVRALGYATPIAKLATPAGTNAVLAVLDQLEQGVY